MFGLGINLRNISDIGHGNGFGQVSVDNRHRPNFSQQDVVEPDFYSLSDSPDEANFNSYSNGGVSSAAYDSDAHAATTQGHQALYGRTLENSHQLRNDGDRHDSYGQIRTNGGSNVGLNANGNSQRSREDDDEYRTHSSSLNANTCGRSFDQLVSMESRNLFGECDWFGYEIEHTMDLNGFSGKDGNKCPTFCQNYFNRKAFSDFADI